MGFTYNENSTAHNNFARLRRVFQWDKNSTTLAAVRVDFKDALVQQFNFIYGSDNDLGAWQNLCSAIDITPVPDDLDECKRVSLICIVDRGWMADARICRDSSCGLHT